MAAIAYPQRSDERECRCHLTVVPPLVRSRRRRAVYWRRRVTVLVALAFLALAARAVLGVLGVGPLAASGAPAGRAHVYVVQPGDTLWTIAESVHPGDDVRAYVDRLSAALGSGSLQPGERLTVP